MVRIDLPAGCESSFQAYTGTVIMSCMMVTLVTRKSAAVGAITRIDQSVISQKRFAFISSSLRFVAVIIWIAVFIKDGSVMGNVKVIWNRSFARMIGISMIQVKLHP